MIHVTNSILDGLAGPAGPQGIPGPTGNAGPTGPAPFTILGAYNNGADYGYGDAVYYNGGTYVRTGNPNNPGYPPTPGSINASWTPIADKGDSANLGYITVTTENDPVEGYYTTLEAPGQIVVQSSTTPGLITIQSYEGLQVNTNPANGGIYINSRDPEDKVVTAGDLQTAIGTSGNGEVTRWTPNFTATGLTFTGSGVTHPAYNSHYVKNGRMVSFNIEVNLSTVTNFGTGQYSLTLPFAPISDYVFRDGGFHDTSNGNHHAIAADAEDGTVQMTLWHPGSSARDIAFDHNTPLTIATADYFYISGTYITAQ